MHVLLFALSFRTNSQNSGVIACNYSVLLLLFKKNAAILVPSHITVPVFLSNIMIQQSCTTPVV